MPASRSRTGRYRDEHWLYTLPIIAGFATGWFADPADRVTAAVFGLILGCVCTIPAIAIGEAGRFRKHRRTIAFTAGLLGSALAIVWTLSLLRSGYDEPTFDVSAPPTPLHLAIASDLPAVLLSS